MSTSYETKTLIDQTNAASFDVEMDVSTVDGIWLQIDYGDITATYAVYAQIAEGWKWAELNLETLEDAAGSAGVSFENISNLRARRIRVVGTVSDGPVSGQPQKVGVHAKSSG